MFTNRVLGITLIIIGLLVVILTFSAKTKEDFYIETLEVQLGETCVLDTGYCLHQDRNWTGYILGWVVGICAFLLGAYLVFLDKTHALFRQEQARFTKELSQAKKKDEFSAYLAGFNPEEQKVLKAIHAQDGIKQSTLTYRTGMGKASLSLLLNSLEERKVISRKKAGKTKEVYLQKPF